MSILVSVIVPCYNEERTIRLLLDALCGQQFRLEDMEVVIADGLSTDRTRIEIAAFQTANPAPIVRVVDNLKGTIPAGLNTAISAAQGEIIVRLDAHSAPAPDYVARCVEAVQAGKGDTVGGVWEIRPGAPTWIGRSIAAAAAHKLGVGDARYRIAGPEASAAPADTVPFGAFYKSLIARIGRFDETLLTNEDYEFNTRIRLAGGVVWLDPAIQSVYYARASFEALARQYARYGYWKARMLRRYPGTLRWRQALPPLLVITMLGLAVLGLVFPLAAGLLVVELTAYFGVLIAVGLQTSLRQQDVGLAVGMPIAIAAMHLVWGAAFLISLLSSGGTG
jgi:glycosyltransferase involved in cell wall biosynthesis